MSLTRRSCWSWAGLAAWLASAGLALAIASSLLFGSELADRAWDHGIHVTPAQAAMHAAFTASGLTHHHHGHAGPQPDTAVASEGASVQADGAGSTWGTPFTPAVQPELPACLAVANCTLLSPDSRFPKGADMPPPSPPPRMAEASTPSVASY